MIKVIWAFIALGLSLFAQSEGITPRQFKIEMAKNCEVMMLREKPERKAKKIFTSASTGDCVENMGCIRNITQKKIRQYRREKKILHGMEKPSMV